MFLLYKYKQVCSIHNITYWLIIYFTYMSGTVLVLHLFTFVSKIAMCQTEKKLFVLWSFTVWSHQDSLAPPLFMVENIPRQLRERPCLCLLAYRFCVSLFYFSIKVMKYSDIRYFGCLFLYDLTDEYNSLYSTNFPGLICPL
jgi:hypothetical protein